jgi:predicted double-glycine peptidase
MFEQFMKDAAEVAEQAIETVTETVKQSAKSLIDGGAQTIGFAAVREWTPTPRPGEYILALVAYTQIDTFSCGAVAGASVVKSFYPRAKFEDFYARVDPDQETGTSTSVLRKALRQSGIALRSARLSYKNLLAQIRKGYPVIVVIRNPGAESYHWVVAYGFGRDHIILASNGIPWVHKKRITRKDFMAIWQRGHAGLVCWAERRRLRRIR